MDQGLDPLVQTHDPGHTYVAAAAAVKLPYADGRALQPLFENRTQRIAMTDRFKYVFNGFDQDELCDLRNDPEEMRNQVASPVLAAREKGVERQVKSQKAKVKVPDVANGARNPAR